MLKAAGFSDKIELTHWHDEWRSRAHTQIVGHDGSILEITRGNEYIRIVLLTCSIAPKPFAVYWFRSDEYPERPKTEFHLSTSMPAYMHSATVERVINRIISGKGRAWWISIAIKRSNVSAELRSRARAALRIPTKKAW